MWRFRHFNIHFLYAMRCVPVLIYHQQNYNPRWCTSRVYLNTLLGRSRRWSSQWHHSWLLDNRVNWSKLEPNDEWWANFSSALLLGLWLFRGWQLQLWTRLMGLNIHHQRDSDVSCLLGSMEANWNSNPLLLCLHWRPEHRFLPRTQVTQWIVQSRRLWCRLSWMDKLYVERCIPAEHGNCQRSWCI